jgi:predicted Rdx family selenoprotein
VDLLREEVGVEAELIEGSRGVFEVAVDGAVVAQKSFLGFPEEPELVRSVRQALGA